MAPAAGIARRDNPTEIKGAVAAALVGLRRLALPLSIMALGAALRLSYVLQSDFPLNDGGLFYLMTRELQQAHYRLPAYTAYNGAGLPFAYPPLGFYLAGLAAGLSGWPLLTVMRFLPFLFTALALPAFYGLSRALLGSRQQALLALAAFALLPGAFAWPLMGGGVTRAPGLFFATLALWQAYRLYTRGARRYLLTTTLCAAGAVLSHPAMAWLTAFSGALLFLTYGRSRRGLAHSLAAAVGTALLTAPWWGAVVARYGPGPFMAAGGAPESPLAGLYALLTLRLSGEAGFPLLAGLALLGMAACLARRRYWLPVWLVAVLLLDPRTAVTTSALPLALLAGVGVSEQLLPALAGDRLRAPRALAPLALGFILLYALIGTLTGQQPLLSGLGPGEREAMQWVAANTPPGSTFLVLTGDRAWGADRSSEWFPVLAQRVSVATVQGSEWSPGFSARTARYTALQKCAGQGAGSLEQWAQGEGVTFDYLYVAKRPAVTLPGSTQWGAAALLAALPCDAHYRLVYDGPGAAVYWRQR